jgi:hypothetical protein
MPDQDSKVWLQQPRSFPLNQRMDHLGGGEGERYMSGTLGQKPGPLKIDTEGPSICKMRNPEAWNGRLFGS